MATEEINLKVNSDIGEVSKGIDKAAKSTEKLVEKTEDVGKAAKKSSKGFGLMGKAVKGVGTALKAAGIGLIVSLFLALKEAVERNQKAMDLMETVLSTISTTFNQVVTVLTDVVKWVTESSDRFDGLGKVLSGVVTLSLTPLKLAFFGLKLGVQQLMLAWEDSFLGGGDEGKIAELRAGIVGTQADLLEIGNAAIDAGKDIGNNIGDAISEVGAIYEKAADGINKISIKGNYEQAKATTAATKSALFAAAEFAKLNAEKLKEAELFRQIRDDETKTFADRIEANNKLKETLLEQQELQREQVQIAITAAALLVEQNGNDENKLALMEAQNAELELEETITGQLSEQKTNAVALEKELLETQKEVRAEGLSGLELELQELQDAYDLKIQMAEKAGMKTTAITKKFEAAKTKIVKDNENLKLSAISGFADSVNKIAGEQKGIAVATALMNTYLGVTEVMKDPTIPSTTMKFLAAGTVLAGGLANVKNILSQDVGDGGGGGSVPSASQTPAPQMMSGAFDLSGGVAPEPVQAFVVTDAMTNSQNQLANIRRRATI